MVHLLDLPREVRIQILGYAMGSFAAPETEASIAYINEKKTNPRFATRRHQIAPLSLMNPSPVCSINRQIRLEAIAAAKLPWWPVEYVLDVSIWKQGDAIVPRWTFISKASKIIDVWTWTVRLHGTFQLQTQKYPSHNDWDIPHLLRSLYNLMEEFINRGPTYKMPNSGDDPGMYSVKKLVVDVQSSVLEEGVGWWNPFLVHRQWDRYLRMSPDFMIWFISDMLDQFLACQYWCGSHGELLYRHIGFVEFRKDGIITKTYDLDEKLSFYKNLPIGTVGSDDLDRRLYHIRQTWIPQIQRFRASHGLGLKPQAMSKDDVPDAEAKDSSVYKTWLECADELHRQAILSTTTPAS